METNLEFQLRLNTESEYENLYTWSIDEVDEDGNVVGEEAQIPWAWSFNFIAKEISFNPQYQMTNEDGSQFLDDEEKVEKDEFEIFENEVISAELEPDDEYVSFSMFGTNRIIKVFDLLIYPSEEERVRLWGCPEYTTEIDFRYETQPDVIQIYASVKESKFKQLVDSITAKSFNSFSVRISGVHGFYSGWSPSISTHSVKVLTREHKLDIPEDCEIEPPRTGQVREIRLYPKSTQKLIITQEPIEDEGDGDNWFGETETDRPRMIEVEDLQAQTNVEIVVLQRIIQKFNKLLWGIIFLLGFIVLILLGA